MKIIGKHFLIYNKAAIRKQFVLLLLIGFGWISSFAQDSRDYSTQGTDFLVAFGQNAFCIGPNGGYTPYPGGIEYYYPVTLKIRLVAEEETQVNFTFRHGGNLGLLPVTVQAGEIYETALTDIQRAAVYSGRPYSTYNNIASCDTTQRSLYIHSDKPISAYAMNYYNRSADATNLIPISNLGTDYYHISNAPFGRNATSYIESRFDGFLIVASKPNTEIFKGNTRIGTLASAGDVLYYYERTDLTGTYIRASEPVAYFVTNTGTEVPSGSAAVEILYQQMMPTKTWGTDFLVPSTNRQRDRIRVVASMDNTVVNFNGGVRKNSSNVTIPGTQATIHQGEYIELEITREDNGTFISSGNNPVAVCAYLVGNKYATDEPSNSNPMDGDPAMAWIPPVSQTITSAVISPFDLYSGPNHYILIITPTNYKEQTMATKSLLGTVTPINLNSSDWKTKAGTGYSYYALNIPNDEINGVYSFYNTNGLTVLGYGYGGSESYYYLAGAATRDLNPYFTVDDVHFQEMYGNTYCTDTLTFESFAFFRKPGSGTDGYEPRSLLWAIKAPGGTFVEIPGSVDVKKIGVKFTTPGIYEVAMGVLNQNNSMDGCITKFTISDFVSPTLTGETAPCIDSEYLYTTESGMIDYQWTIDGVAGQDYVVVAGGTATADTIKIQWKNANPRKVTVSYSNADGCTGAPAILNVVPEVCCNLPDATLTGYLMPCLLDKTIYTTDQNMLNYIWTITGTEGTDYTKTGGGTSNHTMTVIWKTETPQKVGVSYSDAMGCTASNEIDIMPQQCCPEISVWLGNSEDWDDVDNWYPPQLVPWTCTDVYIPGDVVNFPSLVSTGSNTCDNIYFLPGAQIGQPQHLKYQKAYIQLDMGDGSEVQVKNADNVAFVSKGPTITTKDRLEFGAGKSGATLQRDKWNMLSMPIKDVVTGDVAYGGYPFAYLRKFDIGAGMSDGITFMKGRWSKYFRYMNEELNPGEGFLYWINGYKDAKRYHDRNTEFPKEGLNGNTVFGLGEMNNILQLPYFEDDYLSPRHRNHDYVAGSNTSEFYYFWQEPDEEDFLTWTGEIDDKDRSGEAYRFITETLQGSTLNMDLAYNAGEYSDPNGEYVLLGNPYMSAFDFAKFQDANVDLIKEEYQIWTGNAFEIIAGTTKIAPMQSFLIELKSTAPAGQDLIFEFMVADIAVADKTAVLKVAKLMENAGNQLDIYLNNKNGSSYTCIRQRNDADNAFCDWDISKIIEYPLTRNLPEVYSLAAMKGLNTMRGLGINTVQHHNITIPLGIATKFTGNMSFELAGMDKYDALIYLVDLQSDKKEMEITGLERFTYDFIHTAALDADGNGIPLENRFLIRIAPKPTSIEMPADEEIIAYISQGHIIVISPANDNIRDVLLYDAKGRLRYSDYTIGANYYMLPYTPNAVNILKVQTQKKAKVFKMISN